MSVEYTQLGLSHELLTEMEVATLHCFVGGSSIQTMAVGDLEANFFPNVKDGNFVVSPSVYMATLGSFGMLANVFNAQKFPATVA